MLAKRSFFAGLTICLPFLFFASLASKDSSVPPASSAEEFLGVRMRGLPAFSRAVAANWAFFALMSLNVG